ncbi:MAG: ATP-binding cassette domain-containing protein, partial [Hyphomicrobiales bacterium]|nr:ATP-binding cassette domain-containing protein [Hyphomicrobiales bacterium]
PPLLHLQNTRLTFGGTPLLDGAELAVGLGERVALVGRNGSGKSTLLKIAAGLVEADSGTRFLQPGATVRYLPQEPDLSAYASVLAYVEEGMAPGADPYRAQHLLTQLGLNGDEDPKRLSGGETRRAALARTLAPAPDILLLDEPTNHLDLPAITWLEEELSGLRSAMVIISHDRRFLQNLSRNTVWLDRGRSRRLDQGFAAFEAWRDVQIEQEEIEAHKLDRQIAREEDWVRYGVTARRKRNVRRMADLADLREKRSTARKLTGDVRMAASEADQSGEQVVVLDHVGKSYGERAIVKDLSMRIMRRDRIGIVGANGAGKTTLINLMTGELSPDSGEVRLGTRLEKVVLDQRRAALDEKASVMDVLTGGRGDMLTVNGIQRHVMGYLKDFLFSPPQARQPVAALSGGERARLLLARALAAPSNLLVLDEPTNDLDLETLDLLEELVADYAGTVLIVSHDRDCLDRVCTAILMSEGEGQWTLYAGGYSDMLAQRGEGVTARKSHRSGLPSTQKHEASGSSATQATGSKPARKLSFKDKHALSVLPEKMAALGRDIEKLQAALADPQLYAKDATRFNAMSLRLTETQVALMQAEEEWLALELLREEIEGS